MQNHGFIYRAPEKGDYHQSTALRLAGSPLRPDGQWDDFLPTPEDQDRGIRTSACASFNTLKAVQILEKCLFGDPTNWSDRFLAKISGTRPEGNDPHNVAEALIIKSTVFEDEWPDTGTTWEEFYADIPFQTQLLAQREFKAKYNFGHAYVGTDPMSMMSALRYSPLGVDVYAWSAADYQGRYKRLGPSGHWTVIVGYKPGDYWLCFDSYLPYLKRLEWNFGFTMVKQYTLDRHVIGNTIWDKAIAWFQSFYPI